MIVNINDIKLNLLVSTKCILTGATYTWIGSGITFIDVKLTTGAGVALFTRAFVVTIHRSALGTISAGIVNTMVHLCTLSSSPATWARALVRVECGQCAGATIVTGVGVTSIGHWCLTQRVGVAQRTGAGEGWFSARVGRLSHHTRASILTNLFSSVAGISVLAIFSSVFRWTSGIK